MRDSIWSATLEAFGVDLARPQSSPAAGGAAAVSARLSVSLLIKVLEIAKGRKNAVSDSVRIDALLDAARIESHTLALAADEDGAAFGEYLTAIRDKVDEKTRRTAMLRAIEVPMTAARSCLRALALGRDAVSLIPAFVAADLGAAALLLSGAVRALLMTVDYNLRQLANPEADLEAERIQLEEQSTAHADEVVRQIRSM